MTNVVEKAQRHKRTRYFLTIGNCLVTVHYLWAAFSVGGWFISYEISQYGRVQAAYYLIALHLGLALFAGMAALFQRKQWRFRQPLQWGVGAIAVALAWGVLRDSLA